MLDGWRVKLLLAGGLLMGGLCPIAHSAQEEEQRDWPSMILKLRQETYQRPGHAQARQQLAIAYNNYGVVLGRQNQWALAAQQLQEAIRLDGANAQFRTNLAHIYLNQAYTAFQQHQLKPAQQAVDRALELDPRLAQGYVLRGEIEYTNQNLKEAKAAWQRALELDPSLDELKRRFEQVVQELPVESKFGRLSQAYFDLRYEEGLERPVGFDVRDALLEARRLVGSDVAYWPKHKLVVLIYSAEKFRALRQETPDWVAGQFDGKIRVPLPNRQLDSTAVKQIIFHEYTHALVYDLTQGRCPIWLNEGLAEYEGARHRPLFVLQLARAFRDGWLVPWPQLSEQFAMALPVEQIALGYQQSHSIVAYLVKRYGFWRIRRLLKAIGEGQPWESVFSKEFHTPLARLESAWNAWLPEFLSGAP